MPRIIIVGGYKAFHGDMRITPKNKLFPSFYLCNKDWLYKPEFDCWYGADKCFPADICEIVDDKHLDNDE